MRLSRHTGAPVRRKLDGHLIAKVLRLDRDLIAARRVCIQRASYRLLISAFEAGGVPGILSSRKCCRLSIL